MYELTYSDGTKILAEYKEGLGWYEYDTVWELNVDDCIVVTKV